MRIAIVFATWADVIDWRRFLIATSSVQIQENPCVVSKGDTQIYAVTVRDHQDYIKLRALQPDLVLEDRSFDPVRLGFFDWRAFKLSLHD
jgi:hypothetical protein